MEETDRSKMVPNNGYAPRKMNTLANVSGIKAGHSKSRPPLMTEEIT